MSQSTRSVDMTCSMPILKLNRLFYSEGGGDTIIDVKYKDFDELSRWKW